MTAETKKSHLLTQNKNDILSVYNNENIMNQMNDDQRQLEIEYLKQSRNYDDKMIQYDYNRRALRRKRQNLLEKERNIQKRQQLLKTLSEKTPAIQIDSQKENEILVLKHKLEKILAKVEYQKSLYVSLSNKQQSITKSNYIAKCKDIDSNYFLHKLKQKERDLKEKKDLLDSRQMEARRVLSEPIDDTKLEELLITDIEEDAKLIENQYTMANQLTGESNIDQIMSTLLVSETNNHKRRSELTTKKAQIQQELQQYSLKKPEFRKQASAYQTQIENRINTALKNDKVNTIINNICTALMQRQKRIAEEEKQIDQIDAENKTKRMNEEKSWNIKVKKVKSLTGSIREIEQLKLKVSDLTEKIENDNQVYLTVKDENAKIKRRINTILRDKDYNSKRNAAHHNLLEQLNKRKLELTAIDEILEKRRNRFTKQQSEIAQKEKQMRIVEERVGSLENQINDIQKKNEQKFEQIQENSAQFEAIRIAYLTKIEKEEINLNEEITE